MFHFNRMRNGNDDIKPKEDFENSKLVEVLI